MIGLSFLSGMEVVNIVGDLMKAVLQAVAAASMGLKVASLRPSSRAL